MKTLLIIILSISFSINAKSQSNGLEKSEFSFGTDFIIQYSSLEENPPPVQVARKPVRIVYRGGIFKMVHLNTLEVMERIFIEEIPIINDGGVRGFKVESQFFYIKEDISNVLIEQREYPYNNWMFCNKSFFQTVSGRKLAKDLDIEEWIN